jgi:hypothetical protein
MLEDNDEWNVAVAERATELIEAIADHTATGNEVEATAMWLEERGGEAAKAIIWDVVKSTGSDILKGWMKSHGLLP